MNRDLLSIDFLEAAHACGELQFTGKEGEVRVSGFMRLPMGMNIIPCEGLPPDRAYVLASRLNPWRDPQVVVIQMGPEQTSLPKR